MPSRWFRGAAGLLLLLLAFQLAIRLERTAARLPAFHSLYLPSGPCLRAVSLGFRPLLADVLYVWSIQYYSVDRADRWRSLERLYDAITDLDPRFLAAYSIGAIILALEAHQTEAAIRLLDKGIAANPDTYLLAWEAAFYARDLGHKQRAAHYFELAMSRPDAPSFVQRRFLWTLETLGRKREALARWQEVLDAARSEYEREVAARHVHDLTLEVRLEVLRQAVERFRGRHGRNPFALEELVRVGLLEQLPVDPEGQPFEYHRVTGEVEPRSTYLMPFRGQP
jgi:tetratricopeptide (TPR) repeat protein